MSNLVAGGMLLFGVNMYAAPAFKVDIVTDRAEKPLYQLGEQATFIISVTNPDGEPLNDGDIVKIEFANEFNAPFETVEQVVTDKPVSISRKLDTPGFLRCKATVERAGETVTKQIMAGFSPEAIQPGQTLPSDFEEFWQNAKAEALKLPLDAEMVLVPEKSSDLANYYKVSIANINNTRMYGFLSVPKAPGKYPIMFTVPGAGPGYTSVPTEFPVDKVIQMTLNVHAFEVEDATAQAKYDELNKDGLYMYIGMPDREDYYYYRTILGLCRGVKFLTGLPQWNGKEFVMYGSSQGGAMTYATTALNNDIVTAAAMNVPAFCDYAANNRGGSPGWPVTAKPDVITSAANAEMMQYYDAVNFARHIKCPVIICVGLLDSTCPPGAVFAAYNTLNTPKAIWQSPLMGHDFDPGYTEFRMKWMNGKLGLAEDIAPKK